MTDSMGAAISTNAGENIDPARSWALNPWQPESNPLDLAHLGKLAEEATELGSAAARCIIQGVAASEPVTKKPNRQWLQDEIGDVIGNIELVCERFGLDLDAIRDRADRKKAHLRGWHSMLLDSHSGEPT